MEVVKDPDSVRREETLTRLVDAYQTPLLRMCYMYLKDRALSEDAVQETFLKAFRQLDSFRGECSEKTWLMRIAVNTCHDLRRGAWFRHVDHFAVPESLPIAGAAPSEEHMTVAAEVMKLPPKLREAVLLYYYQDLSVTEVGQALGIDHASVSGRLKRAREKLFKALKGAYFDE